MARAYFIPSTKAFWRAKTEFLQMNQVTVTNAKKPTSLIACPVFRIYRAVTNSNTSGVPNKSLKPTEITVDEFTALSATSDEIFSENVRAMNYNQLAVRRRSLAPVR